MDTEEGCYVTNIIVRTLELNIPRLPYNYWSPRTGIV